MIGENHVITLDGKRLYLSDELTVEQIYQAETGQYENTLTVNWEVARYDFAFRKAVADALRDELP